MTQYRDKINMLPDYMQEGVLRYIEDGVAPGGFLRLMIMNAPVVDVMEAADSTNRTFIENYIIYFYNYAPALCWRSKANYDAWVANGGLNGLNRRKT